MLSDEQMTNLVDAEMAAYYEGDYADHGVAKSQLEDFARSVEAEVRKEYEAEISALNRRLNECLMCAASEAEFADAERERAAKDEALILQMLEALETGHEAAMQVAADFHAAYKGHRPDTHAAVDADVDSIAKALAAARARLGEKDPT